MIVKLKATTVSQYTDLSEGQLHFVIGIEADDYRIINDLGKPYLYPANIFTVSDSRETQNWMTNYGEDGERFYENERPTSNNDVAPLDRISCSMTSFMGRLFISR